MMSGMRRMTVTGVVAVMVAAMPVMAQQAAQQQPVRDEAAATLKGATEAGTTSWTTEQLVTSTVHEAWMLSGRNEDQFFAMVKQLAAMSAQKRGLVLPETDAAGRKAGEMIKKEGRKDPDQLLYAVVDRAVVKTGTKTAAAAATAPR